MQRLIEKQKKRASTIILQELWINIFPVTPDAFWTSWRCATIYWFSLENNNSLHNKLDNPLTVRTRCKSNNKLFRKPDKICKRSYKNSCKIWKVSPQKLSNGKRKHRRGNLIFIGYVIIYIFI